MMKTHLRPFDWDVLSSRGRLPFPARCHLLWCPSCRKTREALEAERQRFFAEQPTAAFLWKLGVPPVPPEPERVPASRMFSLRWAAGLAVAGLLGVVLLPSLWTGDAERLTAKGSELVSFDLERRRGGTSLPWDGRCEADDELWATWRVSADSHLVVIGEDANGARQLLLPEDGRSRSFPVSAGRGRAVRGWVLDAQPGVQRFYAIFSARPLGASEVDALLAAPVLDDALSSNPELRTLERHCEVTP